MLLLVALPMALLQFAAMPSWAQDPKAVIAPADAPYHFSADVITLDYENDVIIAKGAVEVRHENRLLKADRIVYNRRENIVTATGKVSLRETNGDIIFAEFVELRDDLKIGVIDSLRILLRDDSRFTARKAERFADQRLVLTDAVYSPCKLCEKNPSEPPKWQVRAKKVVHHRAEREIEYQDAYLEVFGVPVMYLPYFRHPDPTVKRATGFLTPRLGTSDQLGLTVNVPFFINIRPDRDLTLRPTIMTREGLLLAADYRQLTDHGRFEVTVSGTYVRRRGSSNEELPGREFRGHIDAEGRYAAGNQWFWGWDLERATDDTYLKRYGIDGRDNLTSDLFVEHRQGRNLLSLSSYAFQSLREEDTPGATPLVLPLFEYIRYGEPLGRRGSWGRLRFDVSAVSLYRTEGADNRRLSLGTAWRAPWHGPLGQLFTMTASLRGDIYWINGDANVDNGNSTTMGRIWPMAALEWRWPWAAEIDNRHTVVEPVVQLVVSPNGGENDRIPNEDSTFVEYDDSNIFSLNRFPGHDRVEDGARINFGVKAVSYGQAGGYASLTLGQILRFRESHSFGRSSGLSGNFSDYVAQATLAPSAMLDLTGRFRLARSDFSAARSEIQLAGGPDWLRGRMSYIKLRSEGSDQVLGAREEFYADLRAKLNKNWSISANGRRDLRAGLTVRAGVGLHYLDECIDFSVTFERDNTSDRDVEPSTSINFRIVLRNLG